MKPVGTKNKTENKKVLAKKMKSVESFFDKERLTSFTRKAVQNQDIELIEHDLFLLEKLKEKILKKE